MRQQEKRSAGRPGVSGLTAGGGRREAGIEKPGVVPQVLGCTAPVVPPDTDAVVFVADGRFHLEAIMIANPAIPAFRWEETLARKAGCTPMRAT